MSLLPQYGILTGPEIARQISLQRIMIDPFDKKNINPNSYNLHTGDTVTVYDDIHVIDPRNPETFKEVTTYQIPETGVTLRPGHLYLIPTKEVIGSDYYEPIFTGRSSMGRLGCTVHQEAGFADIGYKGQLTMQVKVTYPTLIYPDFPIAQIYFLTAVGQIQRYKGKYQCSLGVMPSKGILD